MIKGLLFLVVPLSSLGQQIVPHANAHAHNDYEHKHPLKEALQNGFISVEADVHLVKGKLRVAHAFANRRSPLLENLYLKPLDSILHANHGHVYQGVSPFYLMIDLKSDGSSTYEILTTLLIQYPALVCGDHSCPVKIFLSGNRPAHILEKYNGISVDGRPGDLEKNYPVELMPVISDNYKHWSSWDGKSKPDLSDLQRIRELATRVHNEGKKLRLWAIPDNELAWTTLLNAGVDLINTDHLSELDKFLTQREQESH